MLYRSILLLAISLILSKDSFAQTERESTSSSISANISTASAPVPAAQNVLRLYPYDAKSYVNIYVEWPSAQAFKLSVYDYQFKAWIKEIPVDVRKTYQYTLDVSQLQNGKYKIRLIGTSVQEEQDFTVTH